MKDINKTLAKAHFKLNFFLNNTFRKHVHVSMKLLEVTLPCLHFSLMFPEGEVKSPCFLQVWRALPVALSAAPEFIEKSLSCL
jgi:hypothetical protein